MKIIPISSYEPKDRPWVTRMLRYLGYLIVIGCVLYGVSTGGNLIGLYLRQLFNLDHNGAVVLGAVIGGFLGFVGGMIVSVPYWVLAMLLDDIRAIRVQTAGYAVIDRHDIQEGR